MLLVVAVINARAIFIDSDELSLYRIHKDSTIHSEKNEEKHECIPDVDIDFLIKVKIGSNYRRVLLDLMVLKKQVLSGLYCRVNFPSDIIL